MDHNHPSKKRKQNSCITNNDDIKERPAETTSTNKIADMKKENNNIKGKAPVEEVPAESSSYNKDFNQELAPSSSQKNHQDDVKENLQIGKMRFPGKCLT